MKQNSVILAPSLIGIKIERSFFNNLKGFVIVADYDNEQQKVFYAKDAGEAAKIATKSLAKMETDEDATPAKEAPQAPPREEPEEDVLG